MRPKIFISSVSGELRTARQKVADAIRHLGFEPVWQEDFPTDAGTIRAILEEKIDQCEGLIQLLGTAYGFEPREKISEFESFDRISYTQFEYLYARKKGLKTWLIAVGDEVRRDTPVGGLDLPPTSDYPDPAAYQKLRFELQERYREVLLGGDDLTHTVNDNEELARISGRIPPAFQDLVEAYRRKLRFILGGIVSILVMLCVALALTLRTSAQTDTLVQESAEIKSTTSAIATDTEEILRVSDEIGKTTDLIAANTNELVATSSRISSATEQTASGVQDLQQQVEELNTQAVKEAEASFVYLDTLVDEAFLWGRLEPSYRVNLAATNAALAIGQSPQTLKASLRSNERLSIGNESARMKIVAARQAIDMDAIGLRESAQKLAQGEVEFLKVEDDEKSRTVSLMRFVEYRKMEIVALLLQRSEGSVEAAEVARQTVAFISPEDNTVAYAAALALCADVLSHSSAKSDESMVLLFRSIEVLLPLLENGNELRVSRVYLRCLFSICAQLEGEERFQESLSHAEKSVSLARSLLGDGHPETIRAKAFLGRAVFEVEFVDKQEIDRHDYEAILLSARDAALDHYIKEHVEIARLQYLLWFQCDWAFRRQGAFMAYDKAGAIENLQLYTKVIQKHVGDHMMLVDPLKNLASFQFAKNWHALAIPTCEKIVTVLKSNDRYESRECADALRNKAENHQAYGELDEAIIAHEEAISVARQIDDDDASSYLASQLKSFAETLLESREKVSDISLETVIELAEEMIGLSRKSGERVNIVRSDGEHLIARVRIQEGDAEEAYSHARSAVEYLTKDREFHLDKYDYSAKKLVDFFYETSVQVNSHEDTIQTLAELGKKAGFDEAAFRSWIEEKKIGQ